MYILILLKDLQPFLKIKIKKPNKVSLIDINKSHYVTQRMVKLLFYKDTRNFNNS